jgi:hypothetical protein
MNYTIFSIIAIALSLALVPTIGASNVFATVNENSGFKTEETKTCSFKGGEPEEGECQGDRENSPNWDETTCKKTTNKGGNEVKGDKFSGCTVV